MGTDTGELVFFPRTGGVLYTPIIVNLQAPPGARQEKVSGRTRARLRLGKGAPPWRRRFLPVTYPSAPGGTSRGCEY